MTPSSPLRLAFLVALLCAVSLRLLTPPGWMPNLDGRGSAPLVICTGDGVRTVGPDGSNPHGHPGKAVHEVCAFAGLALDTAPPVATVIAPHAAPSAVEPRLPADQARFAPAWRRPQAPRAPPILA